MSATNSLWRPDDDPPKVAARRFVSGSTSDLAARCLLLEAPMCGILSVVGWQLDPGTGHARLDEALDVLSHRGPDDHGSWNDGKAWLGQRRLAIIDLSQAGHQPMVDPDTGVVITFGGEIYNYIELRNELSGLGHTFTSQSDTEVLLRSYLEWGTECLSRLNGMWAFLIWDPRVDRAFFSRDRFGVKPLYYAVRPGQLALASEPKALRFAWSELHAVDDQALYDFLGEGRLYADGRSFYRGIQVLPPAHYATFSPDEDRLTIGRYWRPPDVSDTLEDDGTIPERFDALFADAVRLRMRSDVPVGLTLSGGLDSTAILNEAAQTPSLPAAGLTAFTSTYDSGPETSAVGELEWARLAASTHDTVRLEPVAVGRQSWLETLSQVAWHMDGPGSSPAVFPLWSIMKQARAESIPVLLEGQGADELLGGYAEYAALDLLDHARAAAVHPSRARAGGLVRSARAYRRTFSDRALAAWIGRELVPSSTKIYRRWVGAAGTLRQDFIEAGSRSNGHRPRPNHLGPRLVDDLTRSVLPPLLQYGDAVSMAHGIETRLPFLDVRLVEFGMRLPSDWKLGNGETKRVLREYLRRHGHAATAARRDKLGYPTPAYAWLAENGGQIPRDVLLDPGAKIRRYCDAGRVERLIERHGRGLSGAGLHLYRLVSTELWLQACT